LRVAVRAVRRASRRYRVVTIAAGPAAGMRVGLHLASNDYRRGDIEVPVQQAVASLLEPGDVFFDVGANVGFFTLVAAGSVDGDATFVAFEPRADVARALESNLRRNDVVGSVRVAAVGAHTGVAPLLVAEHPGGATIEATKAYDTTRIEEVPQVSIDDLVERGEVPVPDLVKIDVEGAEPAVVRGMMRTLALERTIVVYEIDAPTPGEAEAQFDEVDALLSSLGYASERLEPSYGHTGWSVVHAVARPPRS